jgi:hypothetical protein
MGMLRGKSGGALWAEGIRDSHAREISVYTDLDRFCLPCMMMPLPVIALLMLVSWYMDLFAEGGVVRILVTLYAIAYFVLLYARNRGRHGDGPDVRVVLSKRYLWVKRPDESEFQQIDLRLVRSARATSAYGRAWTHFVRVEYGPIARPLAIDFIPLPHYRFDGKGRNALCDEILRRAVEAGAELNQPPAPLPAQADASSSDQQAMNEPRSSMGASGVPTSGLPSSGMPASNLSPSGPASSTEPPP